jgi:beta-glucanase (GH16 family)
LKSIQHLFAAVILITISCTQTGPLSGTDSATYQLVWSDEFEGNSVDTSNWYFEIGGHGWGNNEQEYYQRKNASVNNGFLTIIGKKEKIGSNAYTSSRMTTQGKHEFLYGKIEARIKIPVGQGIWPAFWMLGTNIGDVGWPKCGEIDIMEHINIDSIFYGTLHWENNGHVSKGDTAINNPLDFHVYSVEWDAASIQWYIDGKKFSEINIKNNFEGTEEFHKPFYLLLNLAIGGN